MSERIDFLAGLIGYEGAECVEWPFSRVPKGFGVISFNGQTMWASRAMAILAHGHAPFDNPIAAHKCGNYGCVNPAHIVWLTKSEFEQLKLARGVRDGERAPNARVTEETATLILAAHGSIAEIAETFGVKYRLVWRIKRGLAWRRLTGDRTDIRKQSNPRPRREVCDA